MSDKESAQNVIESYRKRQSMAQKAPIIFGIAALLLIVGAGLLIFWLANPNRGALSLFASPTPTITLTLTPTNTQPPTSTVQPSATLTSQPTKTLEPTVTQTAAGPFVYKVEEGDTLTSIAKKFGVDILTIIALNPNLKPNALQLGQEIIIPAPNTKLPTATTLPVGFKGTIDYTVQTGDSLLAIADRFNSTADAIVAANKTQLKDINSVLTVGMVLKIPVNIATPVPTRTPNLTTTALPHAATSTKAPTKTATSTKAP